MKIGNRLKELREHKGWTQFELGEKLNLSASTIGMYERNDRDPDTDTVDELSNIFNTSTDYLYSKTDDPRPISEILKDMYSLAVAINTKNMLDLSNMSVRDAEAIRIIYESMEKLGGDNSDKKTN